MPRQLVTPNEIRVLAVAQPRRSAARAALHPRPYRLRAARATPRSRHAVRSLTPRQRAVRDLARERVLERRTRARPPATSPARRRTKSRCSSSGSRARPRRGAADRARPEGAPDNRRRLECAPSLPAAAGRSSPRARPGRFREWPSRPRHARLAHPSSRSAPRSINVRSSSSRNSGLPSARPSTSRTAGGGSARRTRSQRPRRPS